MDAACAVVHRGGGRRSVLGNELIKNLYRRKEAVRRRQAPKEIFKLYPSANDSVCQELLANGPEKKY
jgi:hypothetical protein